MDFKANERSDVSKWMCGKTVFITGGTGFIGKLLVEKLLRLCPKIDKIYLLIRNKRTLAPTERLHALLNDVVFEGVWHRYPECRQKVKALRGDITEKNLGLCDKDLAVLAKEANIVFHSAAIVKFIAPIHQATTLNVYGTREVINVCKTMQNLEAFVHVSTCYVNCNQPSGSLIEEVSYGCPTDVAHYLSLYDELKESEFEAEAMKLISNFPNTYTFTKNIAEQLVLNCGLPYAIVRPSIVIMTYDEPFPAYIDNINGPGGFTLAVGLGAINVHYCNENIRCDAVAGDFVVNALIIAAYGIGNNLTASDGVPIFQIATGKANSLSVKEAISGTMELAERYSFDKAFRCPSMSLTQNALWYQFQLFLFHRVPASIVDVVLRIMNREPIAVKLYEKLLKGLQALEYFQFNDWDFDCSKMLDLHSKLSDTDRCLLTVRKHLVWEEIQKLYPYSVKYFLLKESIQTLDNPSKVKKLKMISYATSAILYGTCIKMAAMVCECLTGLDIPLL